MESSKQPNASLRTWSQTHQPFKLLLWVLPSIPDSPRRWALFQIILSFVFFFVALAIGFLTVDISKVSGGIMILVWALFGLGILTFSYALWIGFHWFNSNLPINKDAEIERVNRDDRLHDDIQSLIKQMADLTQKIGGKNGK